MDNKLAVNGGKKTLEKTFPWPLVTREEIEVVSKVVESGEWGVNSTAINHVEDWYEVKASKFTFSSKHVGY